MLPLRSLYSGGSFGGLRSPQELAPSPTASPQSIRFANEAPDAQSAHIDDSGLL